MHQKVEDVKRPLKLGEVFLVPCVYKERWETYVGNEEDLWRDVKEIPNFVKKIDITPVFNHPHSDKENGQEEVHYHADFRFIRTNMDSDIPERTHSNHNWGHNIRPNKDMFRENDEGIVYFLLPVVNLEAKVITPVSMISKSKLKHKCIHKGKCPHRGYDMSQVEADINGIKTCPLHGLKFNKNGKIINR